jgi:hypothetical protein
MTDHEPDRPAIEFLQATIKGNWPQSKAQMQEESRMLKQILRLLALLDLDKGLDMMIARLMSQLAQQPFSFGGRGLFSWRRPFRTHGGILSDHGGVAHSGRATAQHGASNCKQTYAFEHFDNPWPILS